MFDGMARRRRIQEPHLIYHVMARGNGRMRIYKDDDDYRCFIGMFADVVREFEIECWNYCVMPNHYHATLQLTLPNLSSAIRRLNGNYAQWWNRRHDEVGHVFQGRFKSQVVRCEQYLLSLCRYVGRNPTRAKLVSSPEDWPWSSYAATVGLCPAPEFLNVSATLNQFGPGDVTLLRSRFREFVCGDPDVAMEERFRSRQQILGGRTFEIGHATTASTLPPPDGVTMQV